MGVHGTPDDLDFPLEKNYVIKFCIKYSNYLSPTCLQADDILIFFRNCVSLNLKQLFKNNY